jgi:hypothetical protein
MKHQTYLEAKISHLLKPAEPLSKEEMGRAAVVKNIKAGTIADNDVTIDFTDDMKGMIGNTITVTADDRAPGIYKMTDSGESPDGYLYYFDSSWLEFLP